jgi:hypothetical protein
MRTAHDGLSPPPTHPLSLWPQRRFWNDPKVLAKLEEKLGDVVPPPGAAPPQGAATRTPPAAAAAAAVPEIDNIMDAAK